MGEVKLKVFFNGKLLGYERLSENGWEWMAIDLNPDKGERWNSGVFANGYDYKRFLYTGLKDKNGKEIYEGDICSGHSDGNGVITWIEFDGGYDYIFDDGANVGIWEVIKDIQVIGNIYEK